ncbi:MAG: hypothetical protein AAB847_01545 [Patescibacteria group bacterium]
MTSTKIQTNHKSQITNNKHKNVLNFNIGICALFAICFLFFGIFSKSFAANLSFQSNQNNILIGQELELVLSLDTEKESINAIEGEIVFPASLEIKEIRDGDSAIVLWIKKPQLQSDKIIFAGVTPGGFIGENIKIFSIIFKTKNLGKAIVSVSKSRALLNDGNGTPAKLNLNSFKFQIENELKVSPIPLISKDTEPPMPFQPKISNDPNLFDGKNFMVFVAQDKQSGIDHYEIKEGWFGGDWAVAESPYLLKDQQLKSYVYVRAVDGAGNIQTAMISPQVVLWYMNYRLWIIIIICCVFVSIYLFYRLRRWR